MHVQFALPQSVTDVELPLLLEMRYIMRWGVNYKYPIFEWILNPSGLIVLLKEANTSTNRHVESLLEGLRAQEGSPPVLTSAFPNSTRSMRIPELHAPWLQRHSD